LQKWLALGVLAYCLVVQQALAQSPGYPSKPVRWVVPFPAGGSADLMARMIAPDLGKSLGQQVVVENRPGASAIVGAEYVAKSAADGHTILQCNVGQMAINPSLYPKLPYDPLRDFAPITVIASVDNVMVVTPSLPANSVRELIELARKHPGQLNFTSSGAGSLTHLTGELMKRQAKIQMVHVSYKGSAPAAVDTMAGFVQIMYDNLPGALENIKAGKLKALAILSRERSPALPQVPTLHESGFPGYDMVSWQCVAAPAGTPRAVVDRLSTEIAAVLKTPPIRDRMATLGAKVVANTPDEFAKYLRDESAKWSKAVRDAGIKLEE
jgi:tripartite-type tricarboxylate transporter receptor subunit TctC